MCSEILSITAPSFETVLRLLALQGIIYKAVSTSGYELFMSVSLKIRMH